MDTEWYFIPVAIYVLTFYVITLSTFKIFRQVAQRHQRPKCCRQPSSNQQGQRTQMQNIGYDSTLCLWLVFGFLSSPLSNVNDGQGYWIHDHSKDCLRLCHNCCFRQLFFEFACVLLENWGDTASCEEYSQKTLARLVKTKT